MELRGGKEEAAFVLNYRLPDGWAKAYAHYSLDDGLSWSSKSNLGDTTGDLEVVDKSMGGERWVKIRIPAPDPSAKMRVVLHDGKGQWDSTPKDGTKSYYELPSPSQYALMNAKLTEVDRNLEKVLVVTDLDGTLVGDDKAQEEFFDTWQRQLAMRESLLVFNTGRSLDSVKALMREKNLLTPTAVIGSVGTEVWWSDGEGGFKMDEVWSNGLQSSGRWDRNIVCSLAHTFVERGWAHFRPDDEQNGFKVVFGVRSERVAEMIDELGRGVESAGCRAKFIYSGHGDWNYLDVVCEGAGKLEATIYVRSKLGFKPPQTVCCGDSGNDILMLSGEERAIVVGNAQDGLVKWVASREDKDEGNRLITAKDTHARGILEGLRVMGFLK